MDCSKHEHCSALTLHIIAARGDELMEANLLIKCYNIIIGKKRPHFVSFF